MVGPAGIFAQPPRIPTGAPQIRPAPIDDPEVFFAYLAQHFQNADEIKKQKASNSGKGNALEQSRAASLGLSVGELNHVDAIVDDAQKDLDKAEKDIKSHVDDSGKSNKEPDPKTMQSLRADRYLIIVRTMNRIQKSLSASSWTNLRSYVNGKLRSSVFLVHAPGPR